MCVDRRISTGIHTRRVAIPPPARKARPARKEEEPMDTKSRHVLGAGLLLALIVTSPVAGVDAAPQARTPGVVSQISPGETVRFDDLDLDGFTPSDLAALADVTIVGAPDCAAPVDDPPPR